MRICIVYDCLFPWTIGGAERWYRNLGERLAGAGHDVTYLTLQQWDASAPPLIPGVSVIAVGPRLPLYSDGKRRIWPPLRFGLGVFWHLLRNRRHYDQLHMASFPYFSLLAAALVRPFASYRIAVDWFEVWSRSYWREYLGRAGSIGWWVQKLCARVPQQAYCFSRLHGARLAELGLASRPVFLSGLYAGSEKSSGEAGSPATLVYAGRMIPEKRIDLLVEALPYVLDTAPKTRVVLFGEGPERDRIAARIAELGIGKSVSMPGFVEGEEVDRAMQRAAAVVQPSAREGYGLVVVEAAARGVPVVVAAGEDNAAVELVDQGRNGFVAASADPRTFADAILACLSATAELRASTQAWYAENRQRLSLAESQRVVEANYGINPAVRRS
jgi:glycosyltransferase involved in cell wall biosynthesis